jgi:hypothetical protein
MKNPLRYYILKIPCLFGLHKWHRFSDTTLIFANQRLKYVCLNCQKGR